MIGGSKGLSRLQLDALREVASIGAGHAATALSSLTGRRINVEVPRLQVIELEEVPHLLGAARELVTTVVIEMRGDLMGRTIQVFPEETSKRLTSILFSRRAPEFPDGFGEMERSALREVSNILASAYCTALAEFLGLRILTSVPALAIEEAAVTLTSGMIELINDIDPVLCLDTAFEINESEAPVGSHFLLIPTPSSLSRILEAIRLA